MNATPNFSTLLDTPSSDITRPKPLPVGTYTTVLQGLPRYDKSAKKQTDFVEFTHKFISAGDDVNHDDIVEAGGIGDKTMRNTFYITENSLWRLKDFLDHCGIEEDDEISLRERIEQTPGKQIAVYISHVPSNDGTSVYANISRTLPVE